jgi:hemoglobin
MCQQHPEPATPPPAHAHAEGCRCGGGPRRIPVSDSTRWVPAGQDLDFPPVPFPSRRLFEVAGEAGIRALVERHYARMRVSAIAPMFPPDETGFRAAVERALAFSLEACGGPAAYTGMRPDTTCMRTRHFPFVIDEAARSVWLRELWFAFGESGFPAELRAEYWDWVEAMSIRMINRRTQKGQPPRIPFETAAGWATFTPIA